MHFFRTEGSILLGELRLLNFVTAFVFSCFVLFLFVFFFIFDFFVKMNCELEKVTDIIL